LQTKKNGAITIAANEPGRQALLPSESDSSRRPFCFCVAVARTSCSTTIKSSARFAQRLARHLTCKSSGSCLYFWLQFHVFPPFSGGHFVGFFADFYQHAWL
jgi:hypothetical protein